MAKTKVNVAAFFEDALKDSGKEQITYLPIDDLDPDENNFYSLEGIDELAGNIELIGLQQPIRVRPGEDGRYTIISGHRRRAAIMMIRDAGSDQFKDGVPCIIERGEASPAMQELRLIYANAATRTMTSADLSKQAERVEMLLYQLKQEGTEFPGRMRDHVAEACKVSKTKLARLHAIRKNLAPDLLKIFDQNKIKEATAYALSQQDEDTQRQIVDSYRMKHSDYDIQEWRVKDFAKDVEALKNLPCRQVAGGGECIHQREHFEKVWGTGYRAYSFCINGNVPLCCHDCPNLVNCSVSCSRCAAKKDRLKKDLKAQRESERATREANEQNRKDQEELEKAQAAQYWKRLGDALDRADMTCRDLQDRLAQEFKLDLPKWDPNILYDDYTDEQVADLLTGSPKELEYPEIPLPFSWDAQLEGVLLFSRMADLLDVSADYLLLRTDQPKPVSGLNTDPAVWRIGKPETKGRYLCTVDLGTSLAEQRCDWDGSEWKAYGRPIADMFQVIAWYPLPTEYRQKRTWDEPEEEEDADDE